MGAYNARITTWFLFLQSRSFTRFFLFETPHICENRVTCNKNTISEDIII